MDRESMGFIFYLIQSNRLKNSSISLPSAPYGIAFMDDSSKYMRALEKLKSKYPDVRIKTHLVKEHIDV